MSIFDQLEKAAARLVVGPLILEGFRIFGHHGGSAGPSMEHVNQILYGNPSGPGPAATPPPPPGGSGGLPAGADQAGSTYQNSGASIGLTDEKLQEALKQIFSANDAVRAKVTGILAEIADKHRQLEGDLASKDPAVLMAYQRFVDGKLAELQKVLDDAKVDTKAQADILASLGEEYRQHGGDQNHNGENNNGGSGGGDNDGGTGSGGGESGSGAGDNGVVDPLAGMPLGSGMGMDPLSALGPALAGLSAVPGGLGGAGAGLPLDALSSIAPLAGQLAGRGAEDGFTDPENEKTGEDNEFVDDKKGQKPDKGSEFVDDADGAGGDDKEGTAKAAPIAAPGQVPAPPAAAPQTAAGAGGSGLVQLPDGSPPVTTNPQKAAAVQAVLGGSGVTDAYRADGVDIPPPGTPVTRPADPTHLQAGDLAQFKSREPVMFMGNGKIWLDGQLQPLSALPSGPDFLAWFDPIQSAGVTPAAAQVPVAGT